MAFEGELVIGFCNKKIVRNYGKSSFRGKVGNENQIG